ncbi:MAG: hypothetical protein WCJ26_11315 [bacterium]
MSKALDHISKSITKRNEALAKFQAKQKAFMIVKEQITRDIEEARTIWRTTLEQLPNQPFS